MKIVRLFFSIVTLFREALLLHFIIHKNSKRQSKTTIIRERKDFCLVSLSTMLRSTRNSRMSTMSITTT